MPNPANNEYKILSAREVPQIVENNEDAPPEEVYAEEDGENENATSTYYPLPQDTWGAGILCIIQEMPSINTGNADYAQYLRTGFVFACLCLNIMLQYMLLWFVLEYVTNPAVAKLQTLYTDYHATCFSRDGTFLPKVWHSFFGKHALCDVTLSEPAFITTMLLIWVTRMLGEFRAVLYLIRRFEGLPRVPHYTMMINKRQSGESGVIHEIVGLTWKCYLSLHCMITLPKLGINVWLTFMGVRWLASTVSFSDLILNALGLQFILDIDEMMLNCLFPERMMKALNAAQFCLAHKRMTLDEDKQDMKVRYHQAIFFIGCLFFLVYCYLNFFQSVIPNFEWDINWETCKDVRKNQFTPRCGTSALWTHEECFPYGRNITMR